MWSRSRMTWSGVELLWSRIELTTKVEKQPWSQLMCCTLICCHMCGCIFQEDRIVVRSSGEKWYRLIGIRIGYVRDIKDIKNFNLQTKKLGCN